MSSEVFDLSKRAFEEMLELAGTSITHLGVTKQCITGAIERKRSQEVVGMLGEAATKVDMLAEDFDALHLVSNKSTVTIDNLQMTVMALERDPADPCVHFIVVADH